MSIYLSRLTLDPRSREVRQDLADCHELHRTLLAAFPQAPVDGGAREHFGLLYRVDADRHGVYVLSQSAAEPDWSHLPTGYLLDPVDGRPNPAVKPIGAAYARIDAGAHYIFCLRANPTKKVDTKSGPNGERRNGRRVVLTKEAEQIAWLQRKAEAGGFALLDVRARSAAEASEHPATLFDADARTTPGPLSDVRTLPGQKITGRKGEAHRPGPKPHKLTFGSVLFEGRLRVTDAERFRATLAAGIGSGKAYGFGLLSIAPDGSR